MTIAARGRVFFCHAVLALLLAMPIATGGLGENELRRHT